MSGLKLRPLFQRCEIQIAILAVGALTLIASGCGRSSTSVSQPPNLRPSNAQPSKYEFEPAVRITAANEPIAVESPGYACPTIADVDGDGVEDLVVGQFKQGKMKWYRNAADANQTPDYQEGQWIKSGSSPAEVPGVS